MAGTYIRKRTERELHTKKETVMQGRMLPGRDRAREKMRCIMMKMNNECVLVCIYIIYDFFVETDNAREIGEYVKFQRAIRRIRRTSLGN